MVESCCLCAVTADIPQLLSFIPLVLSLSQAMWLNLEGLLVSGPLKDMDFSVQEGGGPRILHQVIKCLVLSTLVKNPIACTQRPHTECCPLCWWEEESPERI